MAYSLYRTVAFIGCLFTLSAWAEKPTVLLIGDSLSAAYNIAPEGSWPSLLQERLPQHTLINRSISGATTAQGLALLQDAIKQHQPRLILLELGANDGLQGKPLNLIEANLKQLIEQAKNQTHSVVLIGIRLPPNLGKRYTDGFYAIYERLAHNYAIGFVPFLLDGVAGNTTMMQADGLHPTESAQMRVLENVWPQVALQIKTREQIKPTEQKKPAPSPSPEENAKNKTHKKTL